MIPQIEYEGDWAKASLWIKEALGQMRILEELREFQDLNTDRREVRFNNGVVIICQIDCNYNVPLKKIKIYHPFSKDEEEEKEVEKKKFTFKLKWQPYPCDSRRFLLTYPVIQDLLGSIIIMAGESLDDPQIVYSYPDENPNINFSFESGAFEIPCEELKDQGVNPDGYFVFYNFRIPFISKRRPAGIITQYPYKTNEAEYFQKEDRILPGDYEGTIPYGINHFKVRDNILDLERFSWEEFQRIIGGWAFCYWTKEEDSVLFKCIDIETEQDILDRVEFLTVWDDEKGEWAPSWTLFLKGAVFSPVDGISKVDLIENKGYWLHVKHGENCCKGYGEWTEHFEVCEEEKQKKDEYTYPIHPCVTVYSTHKCQLCYCVEYTGKYGTYELAKYNEHGEWINPLTTVYPEIWNIIKKRVWPVPPPESYFYVTEYDGYIEFKLQNCHDPRGYWLRGKTNCSYYKEYSDVCDPANFGDESNLVLPGEYSMSFDECLEVRLRTCEGETVTREDLISFNFYDESGEKIRKKRFIVWVEDRWQIRPPVGCNHEFKMTYAFPRRVDWTGYENICIDTSTSFGSLDNVPVEEIQDIMCTACVGCNQMIDPEKCMVEPGEIVDIKFEGCEDDDICFAKMWLLPTEHATITNVEKKNKESDWKVTIAISPDLCEEPLESPGICDFFWPPCLKCGRFPEYMEGGQTYQIFVKGGKPPHTWDSPVGNLSWTTSILGWNFISLPDDYSGDPFRITITDSCDTSISCLANGSDVSCADYNHRKTLEQNGGDNDLKSLLKLYFRPIPFGTSYGVDDFNFLNDGLSGGCKGEIRYVTTDASWVIALYYRADPEECITNICDEGEMVPSFCGNRFEYIQDKYQADLVVSATGSPFTPGVDTEAAVTVLYGRGEITWSLEGEGTGFSLLPSGTDETILYIDGDACGSIVVVAEDECGNTGRTLVRSTDGYWESYSACECPCYGEVVETAGDFYVTYCDGSDGYYQIAENMSRRISESGQVCRTVNPCLTWECGPTNYACPSSYSFQCIDALPAGCPQTKNAWTCCTATAIGDCTDAHGNPATLWNYNRGCSTKYWYMNEWKCGP